MFWAFCWVLGTRRKDAIYVLKKQVTTQCEERPAEGLLSFLWERGGDRLASDGRKSKMAAPRQNFDTWAESRGPGRGDPQLCSSFSKLFRQFEFLFLFYTPFRISLSVSTKTWVLYFFCTVSSNVHSFVPGFSNLNSLSFFLFYLSLILFIYFFARSS